MDGINFLIREINHKDKSSIIDFITKSWGSHLCVTRGKVLDGSRLPGFICRDKNHKILGLITYHIVGENCEIITLNSLSENKGLGTSLLNKVIHGAKEKGCKRVWLITTNDNTRAIRYYQKRGFEWVAFHKDAIAVSRKLKPAIPQFGDDQIPIKHELEFELRLDN